MRFLAFLSVFCLALAPQVVEADSEFRVRTIPKGKCEDLAGKNGRYRNTVGQKPNRTISIGKSTNGREIFAEHWGSSNGRQIVVIGQVHGNECSPAYFVNEIRRHAPSSFGIWIIPTLNPDGLSRHSRRNAQNIDLNRDGLQSRAKETRILFLFVKKQNLSFGVHVHSPSGWVGHFNGSLARSVCLNIESQTRLECRRAGNSRNPGDGFLWEGLAKKSAGHESVLIELPRVSRREASSAPRKWTKDATRNEVKQLAKQIRQALYRSLA